MIIIDDTELQLDDDEFIIFSDDFDDEYDHETFTDDCYNPNHN